MLTKYEILTQRYEIVSQTQNHPQQAYDLIFHNFELVRSLTYCLVFDLISQDCDQVNSQF